MGFGSKRGGTRVPNVKLKPVPAPATTSTSINTTKPAVRASKGKGKQLSEVQPEPEAEDEEDQSLFRESLCREKPLLSGFVICFTGIPEPVKVRTACPYFIGPDSFTEIHFERQSQAIAYAQKLGAQTTGALTLDVTHLICDRPGSPKYYVCLLPYPLEFVLQLMCQSYEGCHRQPHQNHAADVARSPVFFFHRRRRCRYGECE